MGRDVEADRVNASMDVRGSPSRLEMALNAKIIAAEDLDSGNFDYPR